MIMPNRHDRRAAFSQFKAERRASLRSARSIKNKENRINFISQVLTRFRHSYPWFDEDRYLRDAGLERLNGGGLGICEGTSKNSG
jgi:hypothetical protein